MWLMHCPASCVTTSCPFPGSHWPRNNLANPLRVVFSPSTWNSSFLYGFSQVYIKVQLLGEVGQEQAGLLSSCLSLREPVGLCPAFGTSRPGK